jgi:hypothetical protein
MTTNLLHLAAYALLALGVIGVLIQLAPLVSRLIPHPTKDPQMSFAQLIALVAALQSATAELPALIAEIKVILGEVRAIFPASTPAEIQAALAQLQAQNPTPTPTPKPPA